MNVWFFEEFPGKRSFERAKLINFPSTIFIAAKSVKEFLEAESQLNQINPRIKAAYWPTLRHSYWVSGFSNTSELETLYSELSGIHRKLKVLIDLELPTMKPSLFIKNLGSLSKNKILIQKILTLRNITIFTAEYPNISISKRIMKLLGIIYPGNIPIPMCYTSMVFPPLKILLRKTQSEFVGLGVIARGILETEKLLKPRDLDEDLRAFKSLGTKTVVIFRLGGLNKGYLNVIDKYS